MAGKSKKQPKENSDVPEVSARERGTSRLRRITPSLPPASVRLTDDRQLLSPAAQRKLEADLNVLARRRQDAEARAGSIQLS